MRDTDRRHYNFRKWEIPQLEEEPSFQKLENFEIHLYLYDCAEEFGRKLKSEKWGGLIFRETRSYMRFHRKDEMIPWKSLFWWRYLHEFRCFHEMSSWISLFSRSVFMNFAVFTKCLHEFERFDRCVSYFRKQRHRSCWKINLLGRDEGKWDSWISRSHILGMV